MRFWDASALIPLLINEPRSDHLKVLGKEETGVAVWWGTLVECASALVRREQGGAISAVARDNGLAALSAGSDLWFAVEPETPVRDAAVRAVRVHGLSAGDAFQLGAALHWAQHRPGGLEFVCLDARLRQAAAREGFTVLP